ncbi:uncharacterized protein LOC141588415 [Silene latifolia]|uniref:uncharacterized protein LOC141588415 n=1 Tax=Silene latifolia TaxID=37657 RepID=UPI003D787E53
MPNINADPRMRVTDLIDVDRACWNMEAVRTVLTEADASLVLKLPLSSRLPPDERYWLPSKDGCYSVKSGYWLGRRSCIAPADVGHNRCAWTRTHWEGSGFWEVIEAAPNGSCVERMAWILQQLGVGERGGFLAIMWSIWTIRNKCLFEEAPPPAEAVCSEIVKMVAEYQGYADRVFGKTIMVTEVGGCSWTPPAAGFIKINVDAHVAGSGVVGLGVVARDMAGRVVGMGCRRVEADWDVEVAEARAASFGLDLANRLGFPNIILKVTRLMWCWP